jgi:tetratricopeptide (TPR) repeat protein
LIRADDLNRSFVRADNIKARALLEEAVVLDPDFVSAWVELGWVYWADVYFGWSVASEQSAKLANEAAARALALEPEYPNTYSLLGFMALTTKDFERGIELCEKGASLAPNNAEIVAELASILILAGRVEEAEQFIRRAIRLSPICPPYYLIIVGLCHLVKSDLESAVSNLRIAVEQLPDSIWPKVHLISALVESSHLEEARKLAHEVQSLERDFSIDAWHAIRFKDPEFRARTHDNLRKAGLSE